MAPSLTRYETETTINVSQGAQSSPTNTEPKLHVKATPELVEDSFKDISKGGPVQSPRQRQPDESDDIYDLSPQGKAAYEKLIASATKPNSPDQDHFNVADGAEDPTITETSPDPISHNEPNTTLAANAVDALLKQGAKVHERTTTNELFMRKSSDARHAGMPVVCIGTQTGVNSTIDATDELQRDDNTLNKPVRSRSKSPREMQLQKPPTISRYDLAQRQNGVASTNRVAPGTTSSLAALQAKRQAEGSAPQLETPQVAEGANKSTKNPVSGTRSSRRPLQAKDRNVQTPAPSHRSERGPSVQTTTTGKLPSRKDRMLAQTPSNVDTVKASRAVETSRKDNSDSSNIVLNRKSAEKDYERHRKVYHSPAKPTGVRSKLRKQTESSTYEVPESSDAEEMSRPSKKAKTSKAANAKTGSHTASKPAAHLVKGSVAPRKGSGNATSSTLHGNRARNQAQTEVAAKATSTRAKMKANNGVGGKVSTSTRDREPSHATSASFADSEKHSKGSHRNKDVIRRSLRIRKEEYTHDSNDADEHMDPGFGGLKNKSHEEAPSHAVAGPKQDATGEPSISAQPYEDSEAHAKVPGMSQENAIILSDGHEPSSSVASTPHQNKAVSAPARQHIQQAKTQRPKTPAVFASSPPPAHRTAQSTSATTLVDDDAARKATIISFDKNGPRNQGSVSAKKNAAGNLWTRRNSLPPTTGLILSDTSSRVRLAAKKKQGPSSAATSVKSSKSVRSAPPNNLADDVADALSGFIKKPAQRDAPTEKDSGSKAHAQSTNEAHPIEDDGFHNVDDIDSPTLVNEEPVPDEPTTFMEHIDPSASQVAMPPPASKGAQVSKRQRAPTVPRTLPPEDVGGRQPSNRNREDEPRVNVRKRATATEQSYEQPSKLVRLSKASDRQSSLDPEPSFTDNTSISAQQGPAGSTTVKVAVQPMRRVSRKPSRVASQGSQKVDIHGSPVPEGMTVPSQSTVLETFSQQVGLSSDVTLEAVTIVGRSAGGTNSGLIPAKQQPAPLKFRQNIQSSNSKTRPAGPLEESQANTKIVRMHPARPLVEDETTVPPTDPFTSSDADRKRVSTGSHTSTFRAQLGRMMTNAGDQRSFTDRLQARAEDPDKTLVGSERATRAPKRIPSVSTLSSSEETAETDETTASQHELGLWRNVLQPHQLNLFDELVTVSHKLVRHLIDRETATTDIVNDYRTRGLNIVEQMELVHAKQCQGYIHMLKARKERLRKDLKSCGKELHESVDALTEAKVQRLQQLQKKNDAEDELQGVMADFC